MLHKAKTQGKLLALCVISIYRNKKTLHWVTFIQKKHILLNIYSVAIEDSMFF